jgi:post-segregation antitoxin (ccd killing protein)
MPGPDLATVECVYDMRMARVNVYLPDDLAAEAKAARLNVSAITQDAIRSTLAASATDHWLAGLTALDRTGIDHDTALRSVAEAKNDLWGDV